MNPAFEREKFVPWHVMSSVMCCGKESGNHKMKLVVTSTAKKPQWLKDAKTTNIPVHYYKKGAQIHREISENCLQKMFLPGVQSLLKEKALPQKVVLLLDNAPSHPNESTMTSNNGLVKFLTPHVTSTIQSTDESDCNETTLRGWLSQNPWQ
jgi:hypothetical protein